MIPLLVLVTLFSTAMTSTASSSHVNTGTTSYSALALRKDALVLASLKQGLLSPAPPMDSWDSATPACLWHGVKCDSGRVVAVDLSNLNISGTVSSEFSGLDHLVNLSLAGNQLEGHIKISNMTSLRYLNISGNQFTGGIDWDYSGLPELVVFDAYDNNFTSRLPAGLVNSRKLRYLDLGGNFFFGEIPGIYGNFAEMEYLSLAGNDLRGRIPSELGKLRELKQLYLGYFNMFDGGIPAEMGSMSNLVHLDLSNCGLTGQMPRQLGDLKNLDTLFLHTNLLSGPIPAALGNLTGLISLDLSNNALTGEIPPEFARLQGLTLLNLFMNRLHGSVPEFFARLPMLETLGLFMNNFTGVIPENLGANGRIQVLDMSSNKLTGMIPVNLCASNQLRVLILLKNFLFGPIPEGLGRCSTLTRVRLGQNYLNGSVPPGFLYLPHLNLVELQSNYLTGMIAEDSDKGSRSSELEQLNLSDNLFTGTIPTSISKFSSLQTLQLTNNQFSGPIPAEIGLLRRAVKLDLSQNALSDVIPSEISNCSLLTYLDLSHNNLSGQIPQEISGLGILNYLNVSQNHLNGTVPRSIAGMKSLTAADFSFNDLSGKLPDTGQFTYFNASSFTGNPNLCGPVTNNPCNSTAIAFGPKKIQKDYKLVVALSLLICSLVFAVAVILRARSSKRAGSTEWKLTTFRKVQFTVSDVLECMNDSNVIGRGGAGVVYVGRLPNGDDIAVKRLLGLGHNGHNDHGFKAEIRTLGNIRHRNIVRLLAFCSNSETNLLVYSYMRNGSLGEVLHGKGGSFLGWDLRYRIALESARGLCYLHHDCNPIIVHRDVKSNNILLDSGFEAHVADFGLAKFLQDGGASECMSAIAGSYGYIAPEYAYTLKVDEKSDVYSYGVVLLELLTGRKPVGGFGDGVDILQWTRTMTNTSREHVIRILDNRLSTIPVEEAMHVFFVAMLCTQENSVERPTMREVVQMLSEFPRHLVDDRSPSSSMTPDKRPESPKKDNLKCYKLFPTS